MKKVTLSFVFTLSFLFPLVVSASILTDLGNWIVPDELKPAPVAPKAEKTSSIGGISITARPEVASGDTARAYYLPAGASRSFTIRNEGGSDLFLNKSTSLNYQVSPMGLSGDVSTAYVLQVGKERIVSIANPSPTLNFYLSKTDLGVISSGTESQPTLFISDVKSKAVLADGTALASFTFKFTFNNAANKDVYLSRLISPLGIVNLYVPDGASAHVKFIESTLRTQTGDTANAFVVPAGTKREFELTGILDNTKGTAGAKKVSVVGINYSFASTLTSVQTISDSVSLRGLVTEPIILASGELMRVPPKPSIAPVPTPVPAISSVPLAPVPAAAPSVAPVPTPSASPGFLFNLLNIFRRATPSPTPSVTPTPSPSVSLAPVPSSSAAPAPSPSVSPGTSELVVTSASTKIDSAIVVDGQVVGYPVTFIFTASAPDQKFYIAKNPFIAFVTQQTGFGSVIPTINNINPSPATLSGDGSNYFLIPAGESRKFSAFAVLRNDGLTTSGSKILQIMKINYGTKPTALHELYTVQNVANLKAIVKLAPHVISAPDVTPNPSLTPLPSVSGSLTVICYPTPANPIPGDTVYWQVAQSGGKPPLSYSWSGTDGLSGSTYIVSSRYTDTGGKDASVTVTSADQSASASCHVNVSNLPAPSPSSSASPSSSVPPPPPPSPSPSGGGGSSSYLPGAGRMVASTFYSIGEFLDSLFHQ